MNFSKEFVHYSISSSIYYLFLYTSIAGLFFLFFWYKKISSRRIQVRARAGRKSISHEVKYSLCTLTIFTVIDVSLYVAKQNGLTKIYDHVSDYGLGYLIFNFIAILFIHDTYFYWMHRFMHWKVIYRYVHKVHHNSVDPSPLAAFSFHPLEALFEVLVYVLYAVVVPVHMFTLLAFQITMMTLNAIAHLGYEIYPRGFTTNKFWFWKTTSTHHNMHHEKFKGNYGLYFTFWDRWLKTEFKEYHTVFDKTDKNIKSSESEPESISSHTFVSNN
ncbi:MAG TPA: sterol desaturase family protein [Cytophagaceae bacterium]|jgi:sterol desaturase/sphingolipid hydroxylase (fatty acid hydroxylase superfamily)